MIEIYSGNNIDLIQWDRLVETSSVSSFFQTKECYQFYCSLSFVEAFVYGVTEDGKLKGLICGYVVSNGGMLKKFFSRRAIIQGGALLADDISDDALKLLLNYTKNKLRKKAIYVECRNSNDYSTFKHVFEQTSFKYEDHLNFIVNVQETENPFCKLSSSKRRQINISRKAGVSVCESKKTEDLDQFYSLLQNLYKNKIKKPLFPKEFFEKLIQLPGGHLFVAKYNQQVVSGMISVSFNQNTLYEWFVGGDKDEHNHLYPSVAITYCAIEYASKNGFKKFDFMGAGKPNEDYGVREFKEKFGGELVEYGRFIHINNIPLYNIGKIAIKLMSKF